LQTKIEQEAAPEITEIITNAAFCEETTGSAQVISTANDQDYIYHWIFADGSISSSTESQINLPAGQFEVEVEDTFGCISTGTFEVDRHSPIQIELGEDQSIRLGENIQLNPSANMTGPLEYEWTSSAATTDCNNCDKLNLQPLEDVVYSVMVTNEFGCTATDEIKIKVLPNDDYFVPNAFSPDGDGANDYFTVFGGNNLAQVVSMQIFDRWGSIIFEQKGFLPNTGQEGWDGFSKGKLLDKGVYVYVIELEFIDGTRQLVGGDVSIF